MPMRITQIPIKPVGLTIPKNTSQSPTKKPVLAIPVPFEDINMPVRLPEKNQIALQQLTQADGQKYERVILGDVDHNTENLLNVLKDEGKIKNFRMILDDESDLQAEVVLNGGLVNMTKYVKAK